MDDAEVARFWRGKESEVSPYVSAMVAIVAVITLVMLGALQSTVEYCFRDEASGGDLSGWVMLMVVASGAAAAIAVSGMGAVSLWARTAIVLAVVHLALMAAIGALWYQRPPSLANRPLIDEVPVHWFGLGLGAAAIAVATIAGGHRRVMAWLQGVVVFTLVFAVALGAWLPLVASWTPRWDLSVPAAQVARETLLLGVVPPAAIALVVAVVMTTSTRVLRSSHPWWAGAVAVGAITLAARVIGDANGRAIRVYENQGHVLIGSVLFAWGALIALAIAHLRALQTARRDAGRPAPWAQRGMAAIDDASPGEQRSIARLVFRGWLGGFTANADAFTLRTGAATVRVPAGARVIAPLGLWTTSAEAGAERDVLRHGDHALVTGFVRPPDDGPFRAGDVPIAGSQGLTVVVARGESETIRRDLVLALWRPCLLFLIAAAMAAVPAVAAAGAHAGYWEVADGWDVD